MEEKEWLCFEKSGKVSDYLAYCPSSSGRFSEYGTAAVRRCEEQDGAGLCPDRDGAEDSPGGRV